MKREGLVDVKAVGKPEVLSGTKEEIKTEWPLWSFQFIIWFASQWTDGEALLKWSEKHKQDQLMVRYSLQKL